MPPFRLMHLRGYLEGLLRNRPTRIALAALLTGFGAWSFLPYAAYRIAPTAFVNAQLIRLTAPITGQLTKDLPHKGDLVDPSLKVKLIESFTVDRSRLVAIEREYEDAKARASLAASQITELDTAGTSFTKRMDAYKIALNWRLDAEIMETKAQLTACSESETVKRSALSRAEKMVTRQLIAESQLEVSKAEYFAVVKNCREISGQEKRLKAERQAALGGTFIQDGTGAPFAQQERSSLLLSKQERERELLDARSKMEQLDAEISALRAHVDRLEHYDLNLPSGYIVWSNLASPGSAVVEGQPIMELADCRHPFVVVQFPERDLASITVGDAATIRLVGENEWRRGDVSRVRGSAARRDDVLFAAAVPVPQDNYIMVEIALREDDKAMEINHACNIGRLAEVRLERSFLPLISWFSPSRSPGASHPVSHEPSEIISDIRRSSE